MLSTRLIRATFVFLVAAAAAACGHDKILVSTNVTVTTPSDTSKKGGPADTTGGGVAAGCPTGFGFVGNCSQATWATMQPADTTIIIQGRYAPRGYVFIPPGVSTAITVGTRGCTAYYPPKVTTTSTANVYFVLDTLQGVATCRDSVVWTVSGTNAKAFVMVTVNSTVGETITMTPPGGSGPGGTYGQATCTVTGFSDNRCEFYSTDPSRVDVVQRNVTCTASACPPSTTTSFPWGAGSHLAGKYFYAQLAATTTQRSAYLCAYAVVKPTLAKCYLFTSTATSSIMASVMAEPELGDHPMTYQFELMHLKTKSP
jgi:hypothetical protein